MSLSQLKTLKYKTIRVDGQPRSRTLLPEKRGEFI